MPASVCVINESSNQIDADSTCLITRNTYNNKAWFSDLDIDRYLIAKLNNKIYFNIDASVVGLLTSNPSYSTLPVEAFNAQILFCPVNIVQLHWVLFVYNKMVNQSFYIDPLEPAFEKDVAQSLIYNLNMTLNNIFKLSIKICNQPYTNIERQLNDFDCGPFVCAYAIEISNGGNLCGKLDIDEIRKVAFEHDTSELLSISGGGDSRFNNFSLDSDLFPFFESLFINNKNVIVLSNKSVSEIMTENKLFICENFSFKTFKNINFIICLIYLEKMWFIFIFSIIEKTSNIIDIFNRETPTNVINSCKILNNYLNIFCLTTDVIFNLDTSHHSSENYFYIEYCDIIIKFTKICNKFIRQTIPDDKEILNKLEFFTTRVRKDKRDEIDSLIFVNSQINNEVFSTFFENLNLPLNSIFVNESICTAMLEDCWQHVIKHLDLDRIYKANTVYAVFRSNNSHLLLLIIDHRADEFYLFNPTSLTPNNNYLSSAEYLIGRFREISCRLEQQPVLNNCPHDVKGSGLYSNLLICTYILNFSKNIPLTNLKLNVTCKLILDLFIIPVPVAQIDIENKISANKIEVIKLNFKQRKDKCDKLLEIISNYNSNQIYEAIEKEFPVTLKKEINRKPYLGNKIYSEKLDKIQLRNNFGKEMKTTVNKILNSTEIPIRPEISDIIKHFSHEDPVKKDWNVGKNSKRSNNILMLETISCEEIVNELKDASQSAPGIDEITFQNLKTIDPEGKLLSKFYNSIISTQIIPDKWKLFKTSLIAKPGKTGNYHQVSSWRPIALLSTTYKVFTSILAKRLSAWIQNNNLLHFSQKGGSVHEGCVEHNAILTAVMEQSKYKSKSPVTIAWLDIRDAFGSVPHEYMWSLLAHIGMHEEFVKLLQSLYSGTSSFYKCGPLVTPNIPIKRGVKQGCPISMILFALAINPVLEGVNKMKIPPYMLAKSEIQILAYADDLALIANNNEDLQLLIDKTVKLTGKAGMKFRPEKCAHINLPQNKKDDEIYIYGKKIRKLGNKEFYQYLGVPVGENVDQSPYELISGVSKDLKKLVDSELFDWQKLKAYKIFLHSRLIFSFRTHEIKISSLNDTMNKTTKKGNITSTLRSYFREILKLPDHSELCYFYTGTDKGGLGLVDLRDEYCVQSIVQAFRLLTTPCKYTLDIIKDSLINVVATRFKFCPITMNVALEYLNGLESTKSLNSKKSWWLRPRHEVNYLKNTHKISVLFEYNNDEINVRLTTISQGTVIITPNLRKTFSKLLHRAIEHSYASQWHESKQSNFLADAFKISPTTNKLILNGDLGPFSWCFIHKAKTNTLPFNARPMNTNAYDRLCRRCHKENETMTHVLQSCKPNQSLVSDRHDTCLQMIYDCFTSPDIVVVVNQTCPLVKHSRQRVDLMITNNVTKEIFLVDIKCPIDILANFESVDNENLEHYDELTKQIQTAKPKYKVELSTCIIGSLGTIPPKTFTLLAKIGIPISKINRLLKSCAISNIETSAKIWNFHCTGVLVSFNNRQLFRKNVSN